METTGGDLLCSFADIQTRWGCSRDTVKRIVKKHQMPTVKLGSLVRVPLSEILRFEQGGGGTTGILKSDKGDA